MSSVQDIRFSTERIEMGRNFANKIWNASRFVLQGANLEAEAQIKLLTIADRWIFSRLTTVCEEVSRLYGSYEFDDAARLLYRFVWNELCDWYLEVTKTRLGAENEEERLAVSGNLLVLLEQVMKLLHPLMPFITEEIYGYLPQVNKENGPSLFDAPWPQLGTSYLDPQAEAAMETFITLVNGLRSAREELGLAREVVGEVILVERSAAVIAGLKDMAAAFGQLSTCQIKEVRKEQQEPSGRYAIIEAPGARAFLALEGLVDVERERERLLSKAAKTNKDILKAQSKLNNQGFLAKAPAEVVREERERLAYAENVLSEVKRQYLERVGEEMS